MSTSEYRVKCPTCSTEIQLVAEEENPIMFYCFGCNQYTIIHNNSVYNVSFNFFRDLMDRYRMKACGRIVNANISPQAAEAANQQKFNELKNLLKQPLDVKDFIKKIG